MRERMTTEDVDTITPQTIINIRPVVAALKEFFGSSQLAVHGPDEFARPRHRTGAGSPPRRGRPHARARRSRCATSTDHYGRMCPIETPEGPNIGLIGSLVDGDGLRVRLRPDPYRSSRAARSPTRSSTWTPRRRSSRSRSRNESADERTGKFVNATVLCRLRRPARRGRSQDVQYMDVNPAQIVRRDGADPVPRAQRREPRPMGLEHAAQGALMIMSRR